MPSEGQDIVEHIAQKYGSTPEQFVRNQEGIRARGAALGFAFNLDKRFRIYNTFDAHRLLHWADLEGRQHALQRALFAAYFTEGRDPSDREVWSMSLRKPVSIQGAHERSWNRASTPTRSASANSSMPGRVFTRCPPSS